MPHNETPTKHKILTPRKLTLLASVAAVGAAVLIAGPGNFSSSNFAATQPAQAAEQTAPLAGMPTAGADDRLRRSRRQGEAGGDLGARAHRRVR